MRAVRYDARDEQVRRDPQDVAAPQPPSDRVLVKAVGAQVVGPGGSHGREQIRAPLVDEDEPPGRGVVRRGRGDRGGYGAQHRRFVDRLVGEGPDGASQPDRRLPRLGGAQGEPVQLRRPHQGLRPPAVVVEREAANDGDRDAPALALDQLGGGRELVGDGDLGDLEDLPVRVRAAPGVAHGRQPTHADRAVGLPVAPRAAERVADDDGHLTPGAAGQVGAQPGGTRIGVQRQQGQLGQPYVAGVHSGGGHDQSVAGLGDGRRTALGHHPHRLVGDRAEPGRLAVPDHLEQPPFGLADHLAGHDEHVAVLQFDGVRDELRQVVPGPYLGQAGNRQNDEARLLRHRLGPVPPAPSRRRPTRLS